MTHVCMVVSGVTGGEVDAKYSRVPVRYLIVFKMSDFSKIQSTNPLEMWLGK